MVRVRKVDTRKDMELDLDVAERLEEEENQSKTVEEALKEYWEDV